MKAAMDMTLTASIKFVKHLLFMRVMTTIAKAVFIIVLAFVAFRLVRKYSKRVRLIINVKMANFFGKHMLK